MRRAGMALALTLAAVSAANAVQVSIDNGTAPAGGIVALDVRMTSVTTPPEALVLVLDYNPQQLTLCKVTTVMGLAGLTVDFEPRAGGATLVLFGGAMEEGATLRLYLEVAPGVTNGTSIPITDGGSSAATAEAEALDLAVSETIVTVAPLSQAHRGDTDGNGRFSLSELLRVIQLFSLGPLYCDSASEDGFSATPDDRSCPPHDSDYAPQDWRVDLSELLRAIQFYNSLKGAYHEESGGEDGYAPGPASPGQDE